RPPDDPIVKAELQAVLGRIDFHLGLHAEASELQRQAATSFAATGTHPLQLVEVELDRAETSLEAVDMKPAVSMLDAASAGLTAIADAPVRDHIRLLTLRASLAVTQRNFADAKREADAALDLARHPPVDDRLLAHALLLAGDAEWGLHALDPAEQHFRDGLTLAENTEGSEGLTVASLHRNLGIIAASRSHYADALAQVHATLDIHNKVLGPEHPQTLDDMVDIAQYEQHLGHYREARELLQKTDAIQQRTLGAESPSRAGTLVDLGLALIDDGDLDGAERAFNDAIRIWEPKLGRDFQGVQFAVGNLGHVHRLQGRLDEAEAELTEVKRTFEKQGVKDDPELFYQLGELQRLRGSKEAAVELDRQAVGFAQAKEGEGSETTALAHHYLALALRDAGDRLGAEREFRAALAYFSAMFPTTGHPQTANVQLDLAGLLAADATRHDEARQLAEQATQIREHFFGNGDSRTAAARVLASRIAQGSAGVSTDSPSKQRARHLPRSA
ncbi:MAG TPA: tetratricopeptide repeat protein, partial [Rhodanobacteraceae bacterium]|nr:tetratricopeptide repeat protein [Rhodanobacteraceae bacterium]